MLVTPDKPSASQKRTLLPFLTNWYLITHETYEFEVSEDKLQYVTIPVGYQHSINNIGDKELVLIIWANELFEKDKPDTFVMEEENGRQKKL